MPIVASLSDCQGTTNVHNAVSVLKLSGYLGEAGMSNKRSNAENEIRNEIIKYLRKRRHDAEIAIAKTESYQCKELKNWCDNTISHWRNILRAIDWLIETVPGRLPSQKDKSSSKGKNNGMA